MNEHDSKHPQLERMRASRAEKHREPEKERSALATGASLTTRTTLSAVRGHGFGKALRKSFDFGR